MEAFEEGLAQVVDGQGAEGGTPGAGARGRELDHGGQLLVVTDEDELFDGILAVDLCAEQAEELRFEQLGSLVDDGLRKVLHAEKQALVGQGDYGADDDGDFLNEAASLGAVAEPLGAHAEEMAAVVGRTRGGVAQAEIVEGDFFSEVGEH